jgi:hypothetical protein
MSFSRPIQWYHSHADPTWLDGTFEALWSSIVSPGSSWRTTETVNQWVHINQRRYFAGEGRSLSSSSSRGAMATHSLKHQEILKLFNSTGFDFFRQAGEGEGEGEGEVVDLLQAGNPASPINNYVRKAGHSESFPLIFFASLLTGV